MRVTLAVAVALLLAATGRKDYLARARPLVGMAMKHHFVEGLFVCDQPPGANRDVETGCEVWKLYCNRVGSAQLAVLELLHHELLASREKSFIQPDVLF